ncbi:MAG: hypothetical protein K0R61_144 [Microvirga sp.]|jgi:hypothetical protein|nr:hypothetical protein [Microvirga sp.]
MPVWPGLSRGHFIQGTAATASGQGSVTLTAHATAHTKATGWTQVVASLEAGASGLLIAVGGEALTANVNFYVDLAVGGAGAELPLISNLWLSNGTWLNRYALYHFPVSLAKGTRIAAKCSAAVGSSALRISVNAFSSHWLGSAPAGPIVTYGATTATSNALAPSPPGSANTEGNWTQLIAATTVAHRGLILACGKDYTDTALLSANVAIDIGVGAAGVEQEMLSDVVCAPNVTADFVYPATLGPLPVPIPKGSRLAMRYRSSSTQTGVQFVAYGVG